MTAATKTRVRQQLATLRKGLADLEKLVAEDAELQEAEAPEPRERPGLLSKDEAAAALGISRSKLTELVAEGAIRSVRIGRLRRFSQEHIRAFVEAAEQEPVRPRRRRR